MTGALGGSSVSCHRGKAVRRRRSCPATRFGCWSWHTGFPGRMIPSPTATWFSLHGHSAGAQFAARYLVTHPHRLDEAILSAPSTFPMPDPGIPWPNGMAAAARSEFGPRAAGWLEAAAEVRVTVLVGSRDTERRPPAPAQQGATRIERAVVWVESMCRHAESRDKAATIRFVAAEGLDHDEEAMGGAAQGVRGQSGGNR